MCMSSRLHITFEILRNLKVWIYFVKMWNIGYIRNYSTWNFLKCCCLSRRRFLHLASNLICCFFFRADIASRETRTQYNTHDISTVYVSSTNDFSINLNFFCTFSTVLKTQISSTSSYFQTCELNCCVQTIVYIFPRIDDMQ